MDRQVDASGFWDEVASEIGVPVDALAFIYDTLDHACLPRTPVETAVLGVRHRTAQEYCQAFLKLAEDTFGGDYVDVLRSWGLETSENLGRVVYDLIHRNLLRQHEQDLQSDFNGQFDLTNATQERGLPLRYESRGQTFRRLADHSRPTNRIQLFRLLGTGALCVGLVACAVLIEDYTKPIPMPVVVCSMVVAVTILRSWLYAF